MILFLHLPKTGGQTLAMRLAAGFDPARCRIMLGEIPSREALHDLVPGHDFVSGHPGYGLLEDPPPGLRVLSLVREPVAQILSLYRHIRRDPLNPLHAAAQALAPVAFLERFAHYVFDFQARALATAWRSARVADLSRGEDAWFARHLEPAIGAVTWLAPTEATEEFCALWHLETGRAVGQTQLSLNVAGPAADDDAAALEPWLRARPERFALDSLLWRRARQRFAGWRGEVTGIDRATGTPAPGQLAWSSDAGAAIWLTQDWHPPVAAPEGGRHWWAGPGFFPRLRLRRRGARQLRFEAMTFLGVYWDQLRFLSARTRERLAHEAGPDANGSVIGYAVALDALEEEDEIVIVAIENAAAVPPVPLALEAPRRGFATSGWRLA